MKAYAALEGVTVGEAISEAMRAYLAQKDLDEKTGSFRDLPTADFGEGNENLSERIDEVLYGA